MAPKNSSKFYILNYTHEELKVMLKRIENDLFSGNYLDLINKPDIYTKLEVNQLLNQLNIPDLSNYYTSNIIDNKLIQKADKDHVHPAPVILADNVIENANKKFVSPSEKNLWNNKADFNHNHDGIYAPYSVLSGYALQSWVSEQIALALGNNNNNNLNLEGYATETWVRLVLDEFHSNKLTLDKITEDKIREWNNKSNFSGNWNDLTNKPTTLVHKNDTNLEYYFTKTYITDNYYNKSQIDSKLTPYALKVDVKDLPNKKYVEDKIAEAIADLKAGSGDSFNSNLYYTKNQIIDNYYSKSQIDNNYYTKTQVDNKIKAIPRCEINEAKVNELAKALIKTMSLELNDDKTVLRLLLGSELISSVALPTMQETENIRYESDTNTLRILKEDKFNFDSATSKLTTIMLACNLEENGNYNIQ